MTVMLKLEPDRLYSLREACLVMPEGKDGKRIHPNTLTRWRKQGRIKGVRYGWRWAFWGHELLRFLGGSDPVPRSDIQAEKAVSAAREQMRKLGLKHY